jgi:MarR family transcriptional regulator for hemolysin
MDTEETFALTLAQVSRSWRAALDARLRVSGFTQARWYTLLQLSRGQGMTQRELAERVGVEGPTIGRLLDALEMQGLIERRPASADRRANRLHLTTAAQPLLKEINRAAAALRRDLLTGIPIEDLDTCVKVLKRIGDRLEQR